ncbi:hypothetical protein H0H81_004847 [Sphagnurus paluster]|uniref:Uncharacterized protein n=1 Tax=Sphagnurus paluster TaxID=117069 RepID=A0A9P7GM08_9AGAR|nr:hypothetical protein H0H81_004847 [Sphagnurus paluster]
MSLNICAKVEPCGIADLLAEAMAKALVFLGTGLDIVRASERLDCLLSLRENLETSDEINDPQARHENETQIRKEISKIECANALYFETAASDAVYRPSQLPGLLPVLEKLRGVDFLVAEVPMKVKLGELVKRWSAVV